jgi:hypothetical protein
VAAGAREELEPDHFFALVSAVELSATRYT